MDKPNLDEHGIPIDPHWYRDGLRVVELGTDDVIATCPDEETADRVASTNNLFWQQRWQAADAVNKLVDRIAQLRGERDAAIQDLRLLVQSAKDFGEGMCADDLFADVRRVEAKWLADSKGC